MRADLINVGGTLLDVSEGVVMGILNVTEESFYEGSRCVSVEQIDERVAKMVEQGADVIDIGGYSTRPNSSEVSFEVELERVCRGFESVRRVAGEGVVVSVDTFRSDIVEAVWERFGAFVVNDVSGGVMDERIFEVCGRVGLPYVLGHLKGSVATMMDDVVYGDMMAEMMDFFVDKIEKLRRCGVKDIILDPCFGFSKDVEGNYELLRRLNYFDILELPILTGLSRKSMICKVLKCEPSEALGGTMALNMVALINGAKILRVHDVKEGVDVLKLYKAYAKAK